mgnify:FL=1
MELKSHQNAKSDPQFLCKTHGKPIQRVNLKSENVKFKIFCDDCLKEIDAVRFQKGDTIASFLTRENYHYFDEHIVQFRDFQHQKIKSLTQCISLTDKMFREFIETIQLKKTQLIDLLRSELDHQNELLSTLHINYKKYQHSFQELLSGNYDENLLKECINLFSEIDKRTTNRHSTKNDTPQSKYVLELYNASSNLISRTQKSLEELFTNSNANNNSSVASWKRSPIRPPTSSAKDISPRITRPIASNGQTTIEKQLSARGGSHSPLKPVGYSNDTIFPAKNSWTFGRGSNRYNSAKFSMIGSKGSLTPRSQEPSPHPQSKRSDPISNWNSANTMKDPQMSPIRAHVTFEGEEQKSPEKNSEKKLQSHNLETNMKSVDTMTYLPDKQLLVYGGPMKGDQHTSIVFYKIDANPRVLKTCGAHSQGITALVYTSKKLFSCSKDCQVKLWDTDNFLPLLILKHSAVVLGVAMSNAKNFAFTHGQFLDIRVWDLKDLSDWYIKLRTTHFITQLYFVEAREWLVAVAARSGNIYVVDYKSGDTLLELSGQSAGYDEVDFEHEKSRLLTAASDGVIKIWNFESVDPCLEKAVSFKYQGGYMPTNSLIVDYKEDLLFLNNSKGHLWVGKLSEESVVGFVNWAEEGSKNVHKILYVRKRQWILAANKTNGHITIINLKDLKKMTNESSPRKLEQSSSPVSK